VRVAIYARYSSDHQRDASIADQLRVCRLRVESQGWDVVEEYADHAISGASLLRPGIQALMMDAARGRFDIVFAEAMDRLSRDQEDIAGLFKRMNHAGVKIITLSEGEVSHLHVGLKGTMNALFLKDLADKTRRGLRGRVELGKSGGGNSYGYDVVHQFGPDGTAVRGDRKINQVEAEIVRRVLRDYAAGKSAKKIARDLNQENIPGPSGGAWGFSTILGNPRRGTGLLNNELYVGRIVWNRLRYLKDPVTGKRQSRLNDPTEWVIQEVPDLRIVDDALWQRAKQRQEVTKHVMKSAGDGSEPAFRDFKRPKYLLSGLTRCGCCGGGYSMISTNLLGCSTARNKGTCKNRANIRRDELEKRVLGALRHRLMAPATFAAFCEAYILEINRLRMEASAATASAQAEVARIDRDLDMLVNLILKGGAAERLNAKMVALEARKSGLEEVIASADLPPPLLHPEMAGCYRDRVEKLHAALQGQTEEERLEAAEALRTLVEAIVLTPKPAGMEIDVRGDLAGILQLASGEGLLAPDHVQKTQKNRPTRAVDFAELQSQVQMVAGAGFEPATFRL
jgi:site-specific DNA recombinase